MLVVLLLTAFSVSLTLLSILDPANVYAQNILARRRILQLFNLDAEESIATWYSSSLLLLCSILLATIAFARRNEEGRYVGHWGALSIVFLYLSVDEGVAVHEVIGNLMKEFLRAFGIEPAGLLNRVWVIPAAILLLAFVVALRGFLSHLPARQRTMFLVSGIVYAGGAIGMEMVNGLVLTLYGERQIMSTLVLPNLEESLELAGVIVFAYALLTYIGSHWNEVRVRIEENKP